MYLHVSTCMTVGIMNYGRLCCLGSQSYLKNKFGLGYQLMFHCSPGRASNIERFVQTNLDGATHIETYAGQLIPSITSVLPYNGILVLVIPNNYDVCCIHVHVDTCSYRLDKEKVVVSELFELLDSVRDQIGIVDWGIKMTTLEDGMHLIIQCTILYMSVHVCCHTCTYMINFDYLFSFSFLKHCEKLWWL